MDGTKKNIQKHLFNVSSSAELFDLIQHNTNKQKNIVEQKKKQKHFHFGSTMFLGIYSNILISLFYSVIFNCPHITP
ncbi:hypothetical protein DERP_001161 [Dermatophagoides pteronyssinus]|uniref:Transmembrane protein n=1 Tax=Dermatophagoides pteronyssinus TaxID=6956 RepID=A0ABQ8JEE5_DERPT|nr:hypothetical protein DERP_001161 [Dermatophagoides pteronyssinus]